MAASKKWQISSFEYKIDFVIVPVLFAVSIWSLSISLPQIILGMLIWSFAEYAVHRFLFHRYFRRDHWAHHLDSRAYIGISGVYVGIAYGVLLLPAWWLGLRLVYAGFMLGYFFYLVVHYVIHRPDHKLHRFFGGLARSHELHHQKGLEKNFGVSSPIWDLVFFTHTRSSRHR